MLQTKCLLKSHTLYKLFAEDSFPMNNIYRFAYFLKLLDGRPTPYSKTTQIWYCNETIVFFNMGTTDSAQDNV